LRVLACGPAPLPGIVVAKHARWRLHSQRASGEQVANGERFKERCRGLDRPLDVDAICRERLRELLAVCKKEIVGRFERVEHRCIFHVFVDPAQIVCKAEQLAHVVVLHCCTCARQEPELACHLPPAPLA
ncbi:MAG: hypothetical protein ACK55I_03980, partial [bacterium]